jgi:hypothetical protein
MSARPAVLTIASGSSVAGLIVLTSSPRPSTKRPLTNSWYRSRSRLVLPIQVRHQSTVI